MGPQHFFYISLTETERVAWTHSSPPLSSEQISPWVLAHNSSLFYERESSLKSVKIGTRLGHSKRNYLAALVLQGQNHQIGNQVQIKDLGPQHKPVPCYQKILGSTWPTDLRCHLLGGGRIEDSVHSTKMVLPIKHYDRNLGRWHQPCVLLTIHSVQSGPMSPIFLLPIIERWL